MPRIFLGLTEIAGYYANLESGLREVGIEALAVDLSGHPFRYDRLAPQPPWIERMTATLTAVRGGAQRGVTLRKLLWFSLRAPAQLILFLWALPRYDVFVFGFGRSFAACRDLPLLRALGKRIVFVFHGSDARPAYLDGSLMATDVGRGPADAIRLTRRTKRALARIERYAHSVIAMPSYGHLFTKPIVSWLAIGVPAPQVEASPPNLDGALLKLLHAPSHPEAKGTQAIRDAVALLREGGLPVELVEIVGKAHHEVVAALRDCHIVIDQLYSDTPIAGFAAEGLAAGRPVVVGGYDVEAIAASDLPECPTVCCHPGALADVLRDLVTDGARRAELGRRGAAFAAQTWSRPAVAERLLHVARGDVPKAWLRDPTGITSVHGCGLSEERAQELIAAIVALGGAAALCVADKPALEAMLLALADH